MSETSAFKNRAIISLGSNQGDRAGKLAEARDVISDHPAMEILKQTGLLENRAILYENQPDFINQLVEIRTELEPLPLLRQLKVWETELGRKPTFKNGPRVIDLDIITYENIEIQSDELNLPHPGLQDREYLQQLMAELKTAARI